jgi:type I restriction enzyme, S subunit
MFDQVPLDTLFSIPQRNGLTKPKRLRGEGVKMVNMGELFSERRIQDIPMDRVPCSERELESNKLEKGDLLFARQSLTLAGAGQSSIFLGDQEDVVFESHLIRCRLDKSKVDPLYYFYFFESKFGKQRIGSIVEQVAAAGIRGSDLIKLPVFLPPLKQQKAIAHILGTLDDKIELNQKMNQTLEEIAKAIFKSWFVDFDPVRAKAEGRPTGLPPEISDLFPDELVDSEIGEIPKKWETTCLSNQLSFVLGGDWGKADESDATPHECRCVRGADIANLQRFVWSDMPTRYLKESSFQKRSLQNWDIVFEISGGSPTQSTGRTVLITEQLLDAYEASVTTSNFCRLLRFSDPKTALFHYQKFRSSYDRDEFFMYETGTTGIKNFGFKYYSEDIPYALPSSALLDEFFEVAQPMIKKSGFIMRENMVLSDLRDTLLPKLISGELRIPDAEKFLEEAGI